MSWLTDLPVSFWAYTVVIVAGIVALALLIDTPPARSGALSQWDGTAGTANHVCYHSGGVQQLASPGDYANFDTVVCKNGWAYDLNDH